MKDTLLIIFFFFLMHDSYSQSARCDAFVPAEDARPRCHRCRRDLRHPRLDPAFSFFHRVHICAISACFLVGVCVNVGGGFYTVTLSGGGLEFNWSGDSEADEVIPRSAPAGWENRHSGLWLSHRLVSPWQGTDMSVHIDTMWSRIQQHLDRI